MGPWEVPWALSWEAISGPYLRSHLGGIYPGDLPGVLRWDLISGICTWRVTCTYYLEASPGGIPRVTGGLIWGLMWG